MDWGVSLSAFVLVFVAELGDKTQLAVVAQTWKHRRPWSVFLGASVALILVTLVSALGGNLVGQRVPRSTIRIVAGVLFVLMGLLVARESLRSGERGADDNQLHSGSPVGGRANVLNREWQAFASTAMLLFAAEMGDKTQLAVFSLAGRYGAPWPVFTGGALALLIVSGLAVIGGQGLSRVLPRRHLLGISALAFLVMGALMIFEVF